MEREYLKKGIYNVKAISKKLGIQPGTLRAWERRYKIVTPKRNEVGHRIYSEHDLMVLKWLVDKVQQGFTISQAVDLLLEEEKNLTSLIPSDEILNLKKEEIQKKIFNSLLEFNEVEAEELINYALSFYQVETILMDILLPIAKSSEGITKSITEGQLRYIKNWIRIKTLSIYQRIPIRPILPKVLTISASDELDELVIIILSIFLRLRGFEVYYLGQSLDKKIIMTLLHKLDPVFLFTIETEELTVINHLLPWLYENFSHVKLGILGAKSEESQKHHLGESMKEWENWLNANLNTNDMLMNS
ncbi:MerR family transcriptional regulator [Tepidibacillus sp. HK-1]|uniref:MerR family transcriptional regulator n=1 Tax=Tepidibacillus sp. HK-1 TaxID=1883407 RepID=UPI00085298AB|nr:MerR family transcriptional regulator [Tepidibacillus sp. HK-1]GBF11590.1 HTH-type transcriptional repressor YcgE [Tepidibacillus sp. HK-1]